MQGLGGGGTRRYCCFVVCHLSFSSCRCGCCGLGFDGLALFLHCRQYLYLYLYSYCPFHIFTFMFMLEGQGSSARDKIKQGMHAERFVIDHEQCSNVANSTYTVLYYNLSHASKCVHIRTRRRRKGLRRNTVRRKRGGRGGEGCCTVSGIMWDHFYSFIYLLYPVEVYCILYTVLKLYLYWY